MNHTKWQNHQISSELNQRTTKLRSGWMQSKSRGSTAHEHNTKIEVDVKVRQRYAYTSWLLFIEEQREVDTQSLHWLFIVDGQTVQGGQKWVKHCVLFYNTCRISNIKNKLCLSSMWLKMLLCSYQRRPRCPLQSQCCGWCSSSAGGCCYGGQHEAHWGALCGTTRRHNRPKLKLSCSTRSSFT